jgi:hypothetical protein
MTVRRGQTLKSVRVLVSSAAAPGVVLFRVYLRLMHSQFGWHQKEDTNKLTL